MGVDLVVSHESRWCGVELDATMDLIVRQLDVYSVVDPGHGINRNQAPGPDEAEDAAGGDHEKSCPTLVPIDNEIVDVPDAVRVPVDDRHSSDVVNRLAEPEVAVLEPDHACPARRTHGSVLSSVILGGMA